MALYLVLCACSGDVPTLPVSPVDAALPADASSGDDGGDRDPWMTFYAQQTASALSSGPCAGTTTQTSRGYKSYWQDDFTRNPSLPDGYFTVSAHLARINSEQQYYQASGVSLDATGLHLRAHRIAPFVGADGVTYTYTSGEVYTANRGSAAIPAVQRHGRWEVCARLPTAQGSWPAIWLLQNAPGAAPGNVPWPPEIDVMEHVGGLAEVQTNVFWGPSTAPQSAEARHPGVPAGGVAGFHQYAVEFDPAGIDYFVDGALIRHYSTAPNIPATDMFLVLDLAVGGVLPSYRPPCDAPTAGTNLTCADGVAAYDAGVDMVVTYVRAYQ